MRTRRALIARLTGARAPRAAPPRRAPPPAPWRALLRVCLCGCLWAGAARASPAAAPEWPGAPADATAATLRRAAPTVLAQLAEPARPAPAASEPIAVLFPDIGEPYRKVFTEIIEGIEEHARVAVRSYPVGANADAAELQAALKRHGSRVVIALGRQGVKAAGALDAGIGVVVGGVSSVPEPERLTGISLTPDPALLFTQLRALLPEVRRVIVVYNPQHNEALLKLAREAARAQGLELAALEARDLAGAARLYDSALAGADGRRDALWLPQDPTTVDEATILPIVLKQSWSRNVAIFSSSFLHVKKGALFALYPNHAELGRGLARLAIAMLGAEPPRRGVLPLREVRGAINLRTAGHLGLSIGAGQQRGFDFVFQEP